MDEHSPHAAVLLNEVVSFLQPREGALFIDATLGMGGHAEALLRRGASVIGLDRDAAALTFAKRRLAEFGARFEARQFDFADLAEATSRKVDGVLMDLGVSSLQLDSPERGFSFRADGPLDMRMTSEGQTAAEVLDEVSEADLTQMLRACGEQKYARRIARALKASLPRRTLEASEAVARAVPRRDWPRHVHVATRAFQALRMATNREMPSLSAALAALPAVVAPNGVAVVISFHSGEDREVKHTFRAHAAAGFRALTKKPVLPSPEEQAANPRSRSAKLRAIQRTA